MEFKDTKPQFMTGEIYFVDDFDFLQSFDLKQEFDTVEYYNTKWDLSRGIIIPNGENEKLKFDIIPPSDIYECFFTGFLYKDNSVLGKIKYIKDANAVDSLIKGQYLKLDNNRLLIKGIWDDANGIKESFWIELTKENKDI
jgi:hypothetical protein